MTETSVTTLAAEGVALSSAGLSIEQREVSHLFADQRKGDKALPREFVYALPEKLLAPTAVLYDSTPGSESILYIWKQPDGRYVRVAVRPNFKLKGDAYTNAVRSGQVVDRADLRSPRIKRLEGEL